MIGRTIGPYQVVARLAEGGMGEVYRATDSQLKRSVALKVLPAAVAADADSRRRAPARPSLWNWSKARICRPTSHAVRWHCRTRSHRQTDCRGPTTG